MPATGAAIRRLVDLLWAVDKLGGQVTIAQLAGVLKWPMGTIRYYLSEARKEGYIRSGRRVAGNFTLYHLNPINGDNSGPSRAAQRHQWQRPEPWK